MSIFGIVILCVWIICIIPAYLICKYKVFNEDETYGMWDVSQKLWCIVASVCLAPFVVFLFGLDKIFSWSYWDKKIKY